MKISSLAPVCILLAALTIGCGDPYQPAANPDAAAEEQQAEQRREAEAERLKAEEEADARAGAQARAQWKRDGGSDE